VSGQGNEVYIGSTFNELKFRLRGHKNSYVLWKEGKCNKCLVYDIFDKYNIDNCKMVLIKEYEVCDRRHLEVYESLWILKLKSINKNIPFNETSIKYLRKEYSKRQYEKNREKYLLNFKLYRDKNKDNRKIYDGKRYEENKEYFKEQNREWRENNKQRKKEMDKQYREKNNQKITCECGSIIVKYKMKDHLKTNKHKDFLKQNKIIIERVIECNKEILFKEEIKI